MIKLVWWNNYIDKDTIISFIMIKYCANQGIFFSKTLSYCKDSANLGVVNQILTVLMIRDWHYHFFMIIWENLIYDQIIITRFKKSDSVRDHYLSSFCWNKKSEWICNATFSCCWLHRPAVDLSFDGDLIFFDLIMSMSAICNRIIDTLVIDSLVCYYI